MAGGYVRGSCVIAVVVEDCISAAVIETLGLTGVAILGTALTESHMFALKEFKKVIRDVKIPNQITIQELSNRMAEKSNEIIKFLFNMKVVATINHNIDKDTAEYIVKEWVKEFKI